MVAAGLASSSLHFTLSLLDAAPWRTDRTQTHIHIRQSPNCEVGSLMQKPRGYRKTIQAFLVSECAARTL